MKTRIIYIEVNISTQRVIAVYPTIIISKKTIQNHYVLQNNSSTNEIQFLQFSIKMKSYILSQKSIRKVYIFVNTFKL